MLTPSACRTSPKAGPSDSSIRTSSGSTTGSKNRTVQDSPSTDPASSTSGPRTGPSESLVASTCRFLAPTAATVSGAGASSGIRPRTAARKRQRLRHVGTVDLLDVPRHRRTHLLGAHRFRRRHRGPPFLYLEQLDLYLEH